MKSTFEKGLSTDFSPLKQPKGTYLNAENIIRDVQGTVKSESGTTLLAQLSDFTNVKVIGEVTIEDEIIFFVITNEGSLITKLKVDNTLEHILFTGGTLETPGVTEETYTISALGSTDSEELSFAEVTSALYDLKFTLNGTVASVVMNYRTGGSGAGDPIQNQGITEYASSSKLLPDALRPIANTEEFYSDGAVSSGYGFLARSNGTVAFSLLDSEFDSPRQVLFTDTKTYIANGISLSTIDTDLLNFSSLIQAVARRDYQGNIILYWIDKFNIPRRLNTSETITATNFTEKLALFTNPSLPRVADLEVVESGGITTGLYKFAIRLVTQTGNTTTFSQISQGIPVVNDSKSAGMHQYDGAPPQTDGGKSIKISVENIDTTYNFVEIVAITYLGEENLLSAYVVGKIPITSSTLEFEYYSDGQKLEEVLLEELVSEAVEYNKAESIVQKDNHLFLANLSAADLTFIEEAMITLANQIEVHFRVQYGEQTNINYTTATSGGVGGGAWRDELGLVVGSAPVFARTDLTIDPIVDTGFENYKEPDWTYKYKGYQRDEVYSFAIVPIFPGGIHGTAFHIPGDSTPGRISTKEDNAAETGTRLRSWQNADATLHHRMPSHTRLPVHRFLSGSGIQTIGLDFKNIDLAAVGLDTILEGYTIVRQRRNKPGNGIVVTTGIAKELFDDAGGGLAPTPFLGSGAFNNGWDLEPVYGDKVLTSGDPNDIDFDINRQGYFMFYSPDVIHGLIGNEYYSNMQEIKQVDIRSVQCFADNRGSQQNVAPHSFRFGASFRDTASLRQDPAADTSTLGISQVLDTSPTKHIPSFIANSQRSQTLGDGTNVKSAGMTDVLIMKVQNESLNKEKDFYAGPNIYGMSRYVSIGNLFRPDDTYYNVVQNSQSMDIYAVYSYINNVYGDLDLAEYIMAKEVYLNDSPGTEIEVWGGDTFLNTYMFTMGERQIDTYGVSGEIARDVRGNVQLTVETRGNYDYRHFEAITFEGDTEIEGTMPYAPKYPLLYSYQPDETGQTGLWNYDTSKGPGSSYNKHYNFENTLNKYYPKDIAFIPVTDFPDRIIYSLESFENEQFDAYRTFLINNFHDIPKETGEISNIFEYNNVLYAHTPHSLWRTFVNERTFTNTTSGDIVLGNGGLFPIPSNQIYTQSGGFAGSSAKFASVNTPYGRVYVDDHQRKVFILIGSSRLEEISDPYMFKFFANKIFPSKIDDYQMGYDPLFKRFILSFGDNTSISYSFELKSWSSFHTYSVDKFSSRDNLLFAAVGNSLYELGLGPTNNIFDTIHPSKLSLVINDITDNKEFRNLKWIQRNKSNIFDEIIVRTENFTTGSVTPSLVTSFTDEQNFLPLGQQQVHLVGGEHRMNIPPDNNLAAGYTNENFRPTIKGKYGIVDLTFTPTINPLEIFELEEFETEYINVAE